MGYNIVDKEGKFLGRATGDTMEEAAQGVSVHWPLAEDRWLRDPSNKETQDLLIPGTKWEVE